MTPIPNALNYHSGKIAGYVEMRCGKSAAAPFKKAAKAVAWGNMRLPDIRRLGILSGELALSEGDDAVAVVRAHIDAMRAIVRGAVNIATAEMVERTANTRPIGKPDEIERLLRLLLQQTEPGSYSFIGVRRTVVQLQDELRSARSTRFATYDDAAWLRYDNTPYMLKWLDMVCLR